MNNSSRLKVIEYLTVQLQPWLLLTGAYRIKQLNTMLTILRGILAFIGICLIFSGIFLISSKPLSAIALFAVGGLFMAIAYDAFKKPVFFILPIATISFGILFRSLDSKGMYR